jgi:hypothetical protein
MVVCKMKEQDTGGVRFRINGTVVPVAEKHVRIDAMVSWYKSKGRRLIGQRAQFLLKFNHRLLAHFD